MAALSFSFSLWSLVAVFPLRLNSCGLTERSCTALGCILSKPSSKLKNVDLSDNSIGDIGVQELCSGLENPNCALETFR